ncbi:hypothetical protein D4R99_00720 [bacterium]|nr:MAG: hypothetical protein D4R99_00720 [bacterium]
MPAIKAVDCKDIKVTNSVFSGFDTDIELDNVEGFISENNQFSQNNDPRSLVNELIKSINESRLDKGSQERLYKEVFFLLSRKNSGISHDNLKRKIYKLLGSKATDYFVQLASAVSAGLVLRLI